MAKLQAKFSKLIETISKNEREVHEHLNEIALAQNQSGVLLMSILQLLIDKGVFNREEVEKNFDKAKELTLDESGGCKVPLSTLLSEAEGGEEK
jgi:hypothetical protein